MTIASGSRHDMSYIVESTYGTTPATPALTPIRHTGTTIGLSKEAIESEELRDDRQISNYRHGNQSAGGDINFELSYGTFDDFLEAVLCGTWSTNVLKVGTTIRSYTVERYHTDIAVYLRTLGCMINTMSLSVAPNAMITGTFGVVGRELVTATTTITGSTYNSETTTAPFDSFTGTINEGGSAIAVVTAIEFNLENGIETQYVIGSDKTIQPPLGKSRVSGSVTVYLENKTLIDKFNDETSTSIDFTLTDPAGNDYTFDFPNVKYNSGNPEVSGDGSITVTMDFVALYDATDASQLVVTRAPV
jgi:hypothetical protein